MNYCTFSLKKNLKNNHSQRRHPCKRSVSFKYSWTCGTDVLTTTINNEQLVELIESVDNLRAHNNLIQSYTIHFILIVSTSSRSSFRSR